MYKLVVSGSQDKTVKMWNPFAQGAMATLTGHQAPLLSVVVNERDNQVVSASTDKVVKVGACRRWC
jgi:WD40 repeat protein